MKPIDLYEAMDGIPEKYIEAAKPAVRQRGESRSSTEQVYRDAAAVSSESRGHSAERRTRSRKDNTGMSTIYPFWQRITTGFVAAAACAVFVGGGWFIAQQARQNHQNVDNSSMTASAPNFLGGLGQIHAASDMYLMYDNNEYYFNKAQFEASRTGSEVGILREREYAADYFWDGEQFYGAEDNALYRIGMDGKHADETPFYTIDIDEIQKQVSTDIVDTFFLEIKKLADGYYYICFAIGTATDKIVNWDNRVYASIYQPKNGQQDYIPIEGIAEPHLVTDGRDIVVSENDGDLYRITLDPVNIEALGNAQLDAYYDSSYAVSDGSLYYMATKAEDESGDLSYGKIDLKTLAYTDILKTPEFHNFVFYDGKIYALYSDGAQLICADPDMKQIKTVCDFGGMLTEQQQTALAENMAQYTYLPELHAVDDNWFMLALSSLDAGRGNALIDRKTMKAQLFTLNSTEAAPSDEETVLGYPTDLDTHDDDALSSLDAESGNAQIDRKTMKEQLFTRDDTEAAHSHEENVFGGWGRLYPVDWDSHGAVALYRDDINYYSFDDGQWYLCPLSGGQKEPLPARISGAQAPHEPFISDGERVYSKDMIVYSEGNAVNSFDTAQIRAYMAELHDDETDNGYYYECQSVWHIRDRYFMVVTGSGENNNSITIEVWTDDTGRIISHETAPEGITRYFCNDIKTEMLMIRNNELDVIDCPGDPIDCKPDPLAYGKILDACESMEYEYYFTAERDLYTRDENGQPVLITDRAFDIPFIEPAPDHRFFYVNQDPLNFSLREWMGGDQDNEFYAPELCYELSICGFEDTGSGHYNIVLRRKTDDATCYIFLDGATGQVVRQIQ